MPDLYGPAASLLQGATQGAEAAGRTETMIAEEKLRQPELGQKPLLVNQSEDNQKQRESDLQMEKMRQEGQTNRQFTTLTPEMITGLNKTHPEFGFDSFKPGQKIQTDVLLGLMTTANKMESLKPIKSSYIGDDGKEHTIITSFNPNTGVKETQEISAGKPRETGRGSGKGKSPEDRIMQYQNLVNKDTDSIQKYLNPSPGKSRKIPSQGAISAWLSGKTGGLVGELSSEEKSTLSFLKQHASQLKTNLENLQKAQKDAGRSVTPIGPEVQQLIDRFSGGEGGSIETQYIRRKTKDGKVALFDPKTKEFVKYEGE